MTLAVRSVLGSSVEVPGEEAAFRLKRPIDDRDPHDEGNGPRLTTVMKVEQKRANKLLGPETADDKVRNKEDLGCQLLEQSVSPSINRGHSGRREKRQNRLETLGRGLRAKEDFLRVTQETAIGIGTSGKSKWDSVRCIIFCLARALSGRWSWASLGVVLFESNLS
jgi:hypothetical protein